MGEVFVKNETIERGVLCSALYIEGCARKLPLVPREAFTSEARRMIYDVVISLPSGTVDIQVACAMLSDKGLDVAIEIADIGLCVPEVANMGGYYDLLAKAYSKRQLIEQAEILKAGAEGDESPECIRKRTIEFMQNLTETGEYKSLSCKESLEGYIEQMDAMMHGDKSRLLYTGVDGLDSLLGGITGGKMVVIGARPGVGKSAFALQMAHHAAARGKSTLYCSYEMNRNELMSRLIARVTNIDVTALDYGNISEVEHQRVIKAYTTLSNCPIYFMTWGANVAAIRNEAMARIAKSPLSMIVVDYIGLLKAENTRDSKANQVAEITRDLRTLSMDLNIPVIALTQFNRESEKAGREPTISEARDSGTVEQDANLFLILHAPTKSQVGVKGVKLWDKVVAANKTLVKITIGKTRQGHSGSAYSVFDGAHMRFQNPKDLLDGYEEVNDNPFEQE